MSIAEKLTTIAENQQKVYDAGYANGQAECDSVYYAGYEAGMTDGKKAEYDRFWDAYENNGGNYDMAFASPGWTDETYNPKQPIICTKGSADSIFRNAEITNTKQPIEIRVNTTRMTFTDCTKLKTIPYIGFFGVTTTDSVFIRCNELENITLGGELIAGIGFQYCSKLTNASVQSIIDHLADLSEATTKKITFHATVGAKLTEEQKAAMTAKNWTFSY